MAEVTRIIIKGEAGWCSEDFAYKDRLSIDACSISYERIPMIESDYNERRKWSFRTTSQDFRLLFNMLAYQVTTILERDEAPFVTDIGGTTFSVTYSDKTRESKTFFLPSEDFEDCFNVVRMMMPSCERAPDVLGED